MSQIVQIAWRRWSAAAVIQAVLGVAAVTVAGDEPSRPVADFQVDSQVLKRADERIREPADDSQTEALLEAIEEHPYYQEVLRRLKPYGRDSLHFTQRKYRGPDGDYLPERAKLHGQIVDRLLNPWAKAAADVPPIALVLLGLPGSGKTTAAGKLREGQKWGQMTVVNPDDTARLLPEYEGWNGDVVHAEAIDVADELLERACEERHNLVLDSTGSHADRMQRIADDLARRGYQLWILDVKLARGKAAFRAWQRFRKGAFRPSGADSDAGRFISPRLIVESYGDTIDESYQWFKRHPAVQHWEQRSTDVPLGAPTILLEEGSKP